MVVVDGYTKGLRDQRADVRALDVIFDRLAVRDPARPGPAAP